MPTLPLLFAILVKVNANIANANTTSGNVLSANATFAKVKSTTGNAKRSNAISATIICYFV